MKISSGAENHVSAAVKQYVRADARS